MVEWLHVAFVIPIALRAESVNRHQRDLTNCEEMPDALVGRWSYPGVDGREFVISKHEYEIKGPFDEAFGHGAAGSTVTWYSLVCDQQFVQLKSAITESRATDRGVYMCISLRLLGHELDGTVVRQVMKLRNKLEIDCDAWSDQKERFAYRFILRPLPYEEHVQELSVHLTDGVGKIHELECSSVPVQFMGTWKAMDTGTLIQLGHHSYKAYDGRSSDAFWRKGIELGFYAIQCQPKWLRARAFLWETPAGNPSEVQCMTLWLDSHATMHGAVVNAVSHKGVGGAAPEIDCDHPTGSGYTKFDVKLTRLFEADRHIAHADERHQQGASNETSAEEKAHIAFEHEEQLHLRHNLAAPAVAPSESGDILSLLLHIDELLHRSLTKNGVPASADDRGYAATDLHAFRRPWWPAHNDPRRHSSGHAKSIDAPVAIAARRHRILPANNGRERPEHMLDSGLAFIHGGLRPLNRVHPAIVKKDDSSASVKDVDERWLYPPDYSSASPDDGLSAYGATDADFASENGRPAVGERAAEAAPAAGASVAATSASASTADVVGALLLAGAALSASAVGGQRQDALHKLTQALEQQQQALLRASAEVGVSSHLLRAAAAAAAADGSVSPAGIDQKSAGELAEELSNHVAELPRRSLYHESRGADSAVADEDLAEFRIEDFQPSAYVDYELRNIEDSVL